MVEAAGARRARPALLRRRQLPAHAARPRRTWPRRCRASPARPPGHHRHRPDADRAGRGGDPAARADALRAGRRRHARPRTERRVDVQPRDAARRSARRAPSGASCASLACAVDPQRRRALGCADGRRHPRRDRAESCRCTTASSACSAAGEAFQYGGPHLCRRRAVSDRRRKGTLAARAAAGATEHEPGTFMLSTRRGKQFNTLVVCARSTRSPARRATPC